MLFVGAGLARAAYKISTVAIGLTLLLSIGIIAVDYKSLFALFYYVAILMTLVCFALMVASHFAADTAEEGS